jgi:hypothetical protein
MAKFDFSFNLTVTWNIQGDFLFVITPFTGRTLFMTPSVTRQIYRVWKEVDMAYIRYYPSIYLE